MIDDGGDRYAQTDINITQYIPMLKSHGAPIHVLFSFDNTGG